MQKAYVFLLIQCENVDHNLILEYLLTLSSIFVLMCQKIIFSVLCQQP